MHVTIEPDTEVALLLCGRFGKAQGSDVQPLELREYNRLEDWLQQRALQLADLPAVVERDPQDPDLPVDPSRLRALLERGAAMALAVETWTNRGLWVIGRSDDAYPPRLRKLGSQAPPILYGAGDRDLLSGAGLALAVVGSRHVDESALEFTHEVAKACARQGIQIVSGGARGVDNAAVGAAIEVGGSAVGVLAEKLGRAAVTPEHRMPLMEGQLTLVSPYDPEAGFTVGTAMGRNKYIYALADAALVVSTSARTGGTWAGAEEALKKGLSPVFVRLQEPVPEGNLELLKEGAQAFPDEPWDDLAGWLSQAALSKEGGGKEEEPSAIQGELW